MYYNNKKNRTNNAKLIETQRDIKKIYKNNLFAEITFIYFS